MTMPEERNAWMPLMYTDHTDGCKAFVRVHHQNMLLGTRTFVISTVNFCDHLFGKTYILIC